ncbi:hypothetical protein GCM10010195_29960 [Kitasatospora griseola]|nr:hypothetical protein GCM10010195_29960 [Kitasatospora griseola]
MSTVTDAPSEDDFRSISAKPPDLICKIVLPFPVIPPSPIHPTGIPHSGPGHAEGPHPRPGGVGEAALRTYERIPDPAESGDGPGEELGDQTSVRWAGIPASRARTSASR